MIDELRALADQYPQTRSAILPALRLAQERHDGWLPPEAFEEVGEALDLTPAYCKAVASFYDMFHLEPVGRHLVEVCTNVSCALVGAQQVLEAFERELGVARGRDDRGRRGHAARGRVRRRLRLGDGRRGRPPLPRAGSSGRRSRDRRGGAQCQLGSSCSRTQTAET